MRSNQTFKCSNSKSTFPLIERMAPVVKKQKISVCMIVRDEEKFLPDCLKSIKGLSDEIIVLDTGSKDKTKEIALSFGAKVYEYKWNNNFAEARNKSIDYATGDWILILDADERLDEKSKSIIRQVVANPQYDVYGLIQHSKIKDNDYDILNAGTYRLWRNIPEIRYRGSIHESILEPIEEISAKETTLANVVIEHLGYLSEVVKNRKKSKRNTTILIQELKEKPGDVYILYHLAKEYYSNGELEKSLSIFEKLTKLISPKDMFGFQTYSFLASLYCSNNRIDEALSIIAKVEACGINHPETVYSKGRAYLYSERYEESLECFQRIKHMNRNVAWLGDLSIFDYKSDYGIAASYLGLKKYDEAIKWAKTALSKRNDFPEAQKVLINTYKASGQFDTLENYLLEQHKAYPRFPLFITELIQIYESQNRVSELRTMYQKLNDIGVNTADLQDKMGMCAEAEGDIEAAEQHYQNAIDIYEGFLNAHNHLGLLYANNGHFTEGLEVLLNTIEKHPNYAATYFTTGDVLYKSENFEKAADMYQAGILRAPDHAPGFFTLGNCYFQMGAYEAARVAYQQAIAICPDYSEAKHNLSLTQEEIAA